VFKEAFLKTLVSVGVVALATMSAPPAHAQAGETWSALPGIVVDIAINDAAQAYAVSKSGEALRWRPADQRWSRMSGKFVRITGAEGNRPWGVTDKGIVMRYNGLWWEAKGKDVADVAGDARGNIVIARRDGKVQKWEPLSGNWRDLPAQVPAKRVALDDRGSPWAITQDGRIFRFDVTIWQPMPGLARDIAVGGNGVAVISDREGNVRFWSTEGGRWIIIPGATKTTAIAATPRGKPWVVHENGRLSASSLIKSEDVLAEVPDQVNQAGAPGIEAPGIKADPVVAPSIQASTSNAPSSQAKASEAQNVKAPQAQASNMTTSGAESGQSSSGAESPGGSSGSSDPAASTTNDTLSFTDTRETAARVEIGKDGSVFVLITGGSIKRWSNDRKRLEDFPGQLARVAIDIDGNLWGVTGLGRVFRHDGQNWKQISGATASDIAVGADGSVVTADADSILRKYNPSTKRFERIDGRGIQVAVAPDGTPWTIRDDNVLQRCDGSPCKTFNRLARSISIGPDGSVFIVTTQNQLMRLTPGAKTFEQILTPGHTPDDVAVGPNGFPWLIATDGSLLYSKLFERDESADRTLALRTTTRTTGSGATAAVVSSQSSSGFTFTKNMRFDTYSSSLTMLSDIFVGRDDSVFVSDGSDVLEFDEKSKTFKTMDTTFPSSVKDVSTDADGVIWGLDNADTKVYRIKGTQVKTYTISAGSGSTTPRTVSVTGGGDVYAVFGASVWLKETDSSSFKKQTDYGDDTVFLLAIAGAGDIWIINQDGEVQQWTGSKFEDRPKGTPQSATRIRAGADGTVYVLNSNTLLRWNATNEKFDEVNPTNVSVTIGETGVASDGRPWIADTSVNTGSDDIFQARD